MMTNEELANYMTLDLQFHATCDHIAHVLSEYEIYRDDNIQTTQDFHLSNEICDRKVIWSGKRYHNGKCNTYKGSFPAKYIAMSEYELRYEVAKLNKEYLSKNRKTMRLCWVSKSKRMLETVSI